MEPLRCLHIKDATNGMKDSETHLALHKPKRKKHQVTDASQSRIVATLYQKDDQGKWAPGDHTSRARSEYNVTQDWVYDLLAGPSDSLPAETRGEEQNQAKAKGGVKSEGIGVYFHQAETKA